MKSFTEYVDQATNTGFSISKSQMPQIEDVDAFKDHCETQVIRCEYRDELVKNLIPTQKNYSVEKALSNDSDKPIIVSADNHILDGHHRYFHKVLNAIVKADILYVDTSINKLLDIAYDFTD